MDDPALPIDERPIVKLYGCNDASSYEVVAAKHLLTIPDVAIPASPSALANAAPIRVFSDDC
jgi:hypothetical protein